jgi:hypothetical protein
MSAMMEANVSVRFVILVGLVATAVWSAACMPSAPSATPASPPGLAITRTPTATPPPDLPTATTTPSLVCPDTHEPDDTVEQARTHSMHSLTVEGYICHPGDVDIFITPATYGGYLLDFTVDLYDLPADYDLYVYYHGPEIARSTNRGLTPEHVYYFSGPRTGNSYELKVVGADGAFDPNRPYRLRFTMNPGQSDPKGFQNP